MVVIYWPLTVWIINEFEKPFPEAQVGSFNCSLQNTKWKKNEGNKVLPVGNTNQNWVETHHQKGIFALVTVTYFRRETSGSFAKARLFSQARQKSNGLKSGQMKRPFEFRQDLKHRAFITLFGLTRPWMVAKPLVICVTQGINAGETPHAKLFAITF